MPDPDLLTLSATETPALFGASPYLTRWMLYCRFAKHMPIESGENPRMLWGKKLQPLVLDQAADDLRLSVTANTADIYLRRGRLGCTRDAHIFCPDRGFGSLETKCVFDYGVWMRDWDGGKTPPRHHEIQLQQQMYVGALGEPFDWGVLAAWVAGEMYYFERQPIPELWDQLEKEAERFFEDVKHQREPNAFGEPIELPLMQKLFATPTGTTVDLRGDPEAGPKLAQVVKDYEAARQERLFREKQEGEAKTVLLADAMARKADKVLLPHGMSFEIKRGKREMKPQPARTIDTVSVKTYDPGGLQ